MMLCTETITLVRLVKGLKDDTYVCRVISGASWYAKAVVQLESKGLTAANSVKIRIPANLLPDMTPKTGDYAVRGAVTDITSLKDLNGMEFVKLLTVGDNRRGQFPHWVVSGA